MVGGFNTNVRHNGRIFHIQTEDGGASSPSIVTLLYEGGTILLSKKQTYDADAEDREARVRQLMEEQHRTMVRALKSGKLDERMGLANGARKKREATRPPAEFGASVISKRPLHEVILEALTGD